MAKTEQLISIDKVTDDDSGMYRIGEIDFGIRVGQLDRYLQDYGRAGKEEIIKTLSYLIYAVEEEFRKVPPKDADAQAKVSK